MKNLFTLIALCLLYFPTSINGQATNNSFLKSALKKQQAQKSNSTATLNQGSEKKEVVPEKPAPELYVEVEIKKMRQTKVHNGDCTRLQGKVVPYISYTGQRGDYPIKSSSKALLSLDGHKNKDFTKRNLKNQRTNTVTFLIPEYDFFNRNLDVMFETTIKGCHKKCDLCGGYHCNVKYDSAIVNGATDILRWEKVRPRVYKSLVFLNASDGHQIELEVWITHS